MAIVNHAPVIVEIVDGGPKIAAFVVGPLRSSMRDGGGLLTLERAAVMMYRQRKQDGPTTLRLSQSLAPLSTVPVIDPENQMTTTQNGVLLRIFLGDSDKFQKQPLHEAIVQKARELGLAGATVLRGTDEHLANPPLSRHPLRQRSSHLRLSLQAMDLEPRLPPPTEFLTYMGEVIAENGLARHIRYRHRISLEPAGRAQPIDGPLRRSGPTAARL